MPAIAFEGVTPILRVASVAASTGYYVRALGFKVDLQTPWFVSVTLDRCHIFLSEGDQCHPGAWVWTGVADAGALCAGTARQRGQNPASANQLPVGIRDAD